MHRVVLAAWLAAFCFVLPASAQEIIWERAAGPYGGTITALESVGDRLYAGTLKGLFVSRDGGVTWQHRGDLNGITGIVDVDGVLLASTETAGVYRSADSGATWTAAGVPSRQATSIARASDGAVFVGTGGNFRIGLGVSEEGGLFRSVDGGASWQEVTGRTRYQIVWDVDSDTAGSVFAATFDGLLRSDDGGETWDFLPPKGQALYSNGAGLLLVGANGRVYRSTDNGSTWSVVADGLSGLVSEIIEADGLLYAGTYWNSGGRIYKSEDGGASWNEVYAGRGVLSLAFSGGRLFAGTEFHGVIRFDEAAASWAESNDGLTALHLSALHAHAGDTLFAGTGLYYDCDGSCPLEGSVYRSVDGGRSWAEALRTQAVTGFGSRNGSVLVTTATGLHRSFDGGLTWSEISIAGIDGAPSDVYQDENGTLYLAMGPAGISIAWGIYRSSDDGASWERMSGTDNVIVQDFEEAAGGLFGASYDGVYRLDAEAGWDQVLGKPVEYLASDGILYAMGDSLYRSIDGAAWESFDLPFLAPRGLALNSRGDVFVVSWDGVFASSDGGETWKLLAAGRSSYVVTSGDHLVVESDKGLLRSIQPVVLRSGSSDVGLPQYVRIDAPYPNPFANVVTVPVQLSRAAFLSVRIFDVLGREVALLAEGTKSPGIHELRWNATGRPSGTYLVRIHAGGQGLCRIITLTP